MVSVSCLGTRPCPSKAAPQEPSFDLRGCIRRLVWVYPTCVGVSSDLGGCILGLGWVYTVGLWESMESKPTGFHAEKLIESIDMVSFADDRFRLQIGFFRAKLGLFRLGTSFLQACPRQNRSDLHFERREIPQVGPSMDFSPLLVSRNGESAKNQYRQTRLEPRRSSWSRVVADFPKNQSKNQDFLR